MSGESEEIPTIPKWRMYLPQVLAMIAKNLIIVDYYLAVAFPTIVIPVLSGIKQTAESANEPLHFTAAQTSWYGSLLFICMPIGSFLSGWITEPVGRRRSMMLCNLPVILAWILMYYAKSTSVMYAAMIVYGISTGFMEPPIMTYIGEIAQPQIRGVLASCNSVAGGIGQFMVYVLGTFFYWRTLALCFAIVPIIAISCIYFIPETPYWLLARGREEEALKSLQWLRGWVSAKEVEKEFSEMQRYSKNSRKCINCQAAEKDCEHSAPRFLSQLKELPSKPTLRPMLLVLVYFIVGSFSGVTAMRPFLVQIFEAYGAPLESSWATVITGLITIVATFMCMALVKFVGKRKLSLISIGGSAICCISLGIYGCLYLPTGWSSFEKHLISDVPGNGTLPLLIIYALILIASVGIIPIPWMLISEVFPAKTRTFATGLVSTMGYLLFFSSSKSYLGFERTLGMPGSIFLYGSVCVAGFIFFYFLLPETENRTLEDIETHFSTQRLTNIDIKQVSKSNKENDVGVERGLELRVPQVVNGVDNKGFDKKD